MTNTVPDETAAAAEGRTRRMVLAGLGAATLGGIAAIGTAPPAAAAQPQILPASRDAASASTVAALQKLSAKADDIVAVAGYAAPGDGGGGLFRCVTKERPEVNGGTVVPGKKKDVWVRLHDGVLDFRAFGIFGPDVAADDALDAMVNDPGIHRIEAHTDLNFVRRHVFTRSNIVLDFGNHLMTTEGIENAGEDDPFAAVMFFQGTVAREEHTAALGEEVPDLADVFPVGDSSFFTVGKWYAAEVNALSGRWERELQRLVQVTQIVDGNHIRVAYHNGWPLGADRSITWRRVEPVQNVHVSHLRFLGTGTDQYTGSHPLAFEYAVRCDVDHIDGTGTFWPLIMRRWNTHFTTESCNLVNPTSVTWGGAGYLTQQVYCLYGYVANCHTSNARHLNDWTASAFCLVENCHGDGDDEGPFVTHGQYEHDLTYVGNSGLMTFANSGAAWGSAAKRITVRQHVCSWFVARVKVTDLTLEDVKVIGKPSLEGSGMLWINADGAQLRGCSATDTLIITQASDASTRPTIIADSHFTFVADSELTNESVKKSITFVDTVLQGIDGMKINGPASVTFRGSTLAADPQADPVTVAAEELRFDGATLSGVRLVATGASAQTIDLVGTDVSEARGEAISREGDGRLDLTLVHSAFSGDDSVHVQLVGGTNHFRAVGNRFEGGSLDLRPEAFGKGSTLVHSSNVEIDAKRASMPDESEAVVIAMNAIT